MPTIDECVRVCTCVCVCARACMHVLRHLSGRETGYCIFPTFSLKFNNKTVENGSAMSWIVLAIWGRFKSSVLPPNSGTPGVFWWVLPKLGTHLLLEKSGMSPAYIEVHSTSSPLQCYLDPRPSYFPTRMVKSFLDSKLPRESRVWPPYTFEIRSDYIETSWEGMFLTILITK